MKCKKCGKEFEILQLLGGHVRWCGVEKVAPKLFEKICKCGTRFQSKWSKSKFCSGCHDYLTEESRKRISEGRKRWLAENPDKHPWKNKRKFNSVPCEIFKQQLRDNGLQFEPEFEPVPGRHFSLDVAFPAKRIGVEINGNQHYNSDKTLKKYYQDRHDLIVAEGWQVLELHYSIAFQKEKLNEAIEALKSCIDKVEFEYEFYLPEKKKSKRRAEKEPKHMVRKENSKTNRLSKDRLEFYRAKIFEADFPRIGFVQRAAKSIGVSPQQVGRVIYAHFPEIKKHLEESRSKRDRFKGTSEELLEFYRKKILESKPEAFGFAERAAKLIGVSSFQVRNIIRKRLPEFHKYVKTPKRKLVTP